MIVGRAEAPKDSWWTRAAREGFTGYIVTAQLPRMQRSKESWRILGISRDYTHHEPVPSDLSWQEPQ